MAAGAQPYQRQFSLVAGGYMMARLALAAAQGGDTDADFCRAKILTARFFAEALLPAVHGLSAPVMGGHAAAVEMAEGLF